MNDSPRKQGRNRPWNGPEEFKPMDWDDPDPPVYENRGETPDDHPQPN